MKKKEEKEVIILQNIYELVLSYIFAYKPSVKEILTFLGILTHSTIDLLKITEEEKKKYKLIYEKLILKQLIEKKVNKI